MTDNEKNRAVCEWLGLCWHELIPYDHQGYKCSCGFETHYGALYGDHERSNPNPDFSTDPVALLREIEIWNAERYTSFIMYLVTCEMGKDFTYFSRSAVQGYVVLIINKYITTPGALLDKFLEWMKL